MVGGGVGVLLGRGISDGCSTGLVRPMMMILACLLACSYRDNKIHLLLAWLSNGWSVRWTEAWPNCLAFSVLSGDPHLAPWRQRLARFSRRVTLAARISDPASHFAGHGSRDTTIAFLIVRALSSPARFHKVPVPIPPIQSFS
jgi:hypothetical protein